MTPEARYLEATTVKPISVRCPVCMSPPKYACIITRRKSEGPRRTADRTTDRIHKGRERVAWKRTRDLRSKERSGYVGFRVGVELGYRFESLYDPDDANPKRHESDFNFACSVMLTDEVF